MYILYGVISSVLIMIIDFLILVLTGYVVHGYTIFVFIPIAAILEGLVCGAGIPLYLRWNNIKIRPKHYIAAALISITCFVGIYGLVYETAYVSSDMVINHSFNGKHISNFRYDDNKPINFISYTFHNVDATITTSSIYGRQDQKPGNWGTGFNRTSFVLEGGGFMLGGLLSVVLILGGKSYCDKCKKYYIESDLYDFTSSDYNKEIDELYKSLNSKPMFLEFIKRDRVMAETDEPYLKVTLRYCPECYKGFFLLKCMEVRWKDDKIECVENTSRNTYLKISSEDVKNII